MVQSQGPKSLTIGQLAAGGNVGVETIRFYQRKGLLGTPAREAGIRRYGSEDLRRLRFIKQAQAAGFTLEEIRELLELDSGQDRTRASGARQKPDRSTRCEDRGARPCPPSAHEAGDGMR
jgi:MerR family mercuric resistance operon transcriptional regulator